MKAEIKDGKLTIMPESDTEQYAMSWFEDSHKMKCGHIENIEFDYSQELKPDKECKGTKDGDIMVDYVESAYYVDWPYGNESANIFKGLSHEIEAAAKRIVSDAIRNNGGCVDPSIKKCENEEKETFVDNEHGKIVLEFKCDDGTRSIIYDKDGYYTMVRKRGQHIMYDLNFGEIVYLLKSFCGDANLERDEILEKAHDEAASIKSKAIDHYHEMSKCGADKIADGVREAGRIVREAKAEAEKIKRESRINPKLTFNEDLEFFSQEKEAIINLEVKKKELQDAELKLALIRFVKGCPKG